MPQINQTIKLLKRVIADPNCKRMNLSTVKGYLGELIVKHKLKKEGFKVEHKGNQAGYDLEFNKIKIDVKFSTYKHEVDNFPPYWGWALKQGNKKRNISCTHFVCVALNKKYDVDAFYIIKTKHLSYFPSGFGQFKGVKKAYGVLPVKIPKGGPEYIVKFIERSRKCYALGKVVKVSQGKNLGEVLK